MEILLILWNILKACLYYAFKLPLICLNALMTALRQLSLTSLWVGLQGLTEFFLIKKVVLLVFGFLFCIVLFSHQSILKQHWQKRGEKEKPRKCVENNKSSHHN